MSQGILALWQHTGLIHLESIGLRSSQIKTFFFCCNFHVVILHYAKNYSSVLYFPKVYDHTSLHGPAASGAIVDPPYRLVLLPCWYYHLLVIEKYDFRVVPNGITSIPTFIQICLAVLELNHTGRWTQPALCAFIYAHHTKNN
jgi:hypothetical protein